MFFSYRVLIISITGYTGNLNESVAEYLIKYTYL
tara:strand:+ start:1520 stop:1621 length:102 start_codon:yes stop_codon:yes gene_type:complete